MDDILKRMLQVEAEAEEVGVKANEEADKIRENARKEANAIFSEAKQLLLKEVESYTAQRMEEARQAEAEELRRGKATMEGEFSAFEAMVAEHKGSIRDALLFPTGRK